jgi:hypothetical protein
VNKPKAEYRIKCGMTQKKHVIADLIRNPAKHVKQRKSLNYFVTIISHPFWSSYAAPCID